MPANPDWFPPGGRCHKYKVETNRIVSEINHLPLKISVNQKFRPPAERANLPGPSAVWAVLFPLASDLLQ